MEEESSVQEKIYLDYNATTPLEPEVLSSIHEALSDAWGNPSSSHEAGQKAKQTIDKARSNVARMIGANTSDIVFTSGGTEANNMIIQTCVDYFHTKGAQKKIDQWASRIPHMVSTYEELLPAVEHVEMTRKAGNMLLKEVDYVDISHITGRLEVEDVLDTIKPNTILVTVMLANNETGIIQPVAEICEAVKSLKRDEYSTSRILVHTDAAQAIGKIPVDVTELGVDYLTVVGHKFYGPRIGAVYARNLDKQEVPLYPMLYGGGQERNYRPGTENTGMIAGLGKACELVADNLPAYAAHMREVRDYLESELKRSFRDCAHINGKLPGNERLPNTCNVSIRKSGLFGHTLLSRCKRLQASVGAACHAEQKYPSPSPILLAIGIPEETAMNAVRLSVGRATSKHDIDIVVQDIVQAVGPNLSKNEQNSKTDEWIVLTLRILIEDMARKCSVQEQ